jgi:hypothetical protein
MRFFSRFCSILLFLILILLPSALAAQCGLTVNAGPDAFFCPGGGSVQLNGSGPDFSTSWTTADGNILSGENTPSPTIDSAGTYELTVVNDITGCSATRSITVTANQPVLTAVIALPDTLDCNLLQLRLDGSGSATTPGSTFAWTTSDGNILSDAASATPLIDAPGQYQLLVRDPASGCESIALVTVRSAAIRPSIALINPLPFTCDRAQIVLDATASTSGADISYTWTAANGGGIVSDTNTLQPTVMGVRVARPWRLPRIQFCLVLTSFLQPRLIAT